MTWLALPWFVLVTTGSAKQMTLVIAAEAGGYALFGIPSGSLLERLGPQRTMRLCDAVRAPLMLLAPVPAAAVAGALALSGIANGLVNPTLHAFLTLRPPAAVRAKALTATFTASSLGTPLALAVAAPAFAAYGSRHVVAVAAAGQLAAMSYAAVITLRHVARERA